MPRGPYHLTESLKRAFVDKGAFITVQEDGELLLGVGGRITEEKAPQSHAFYLKDFFEDRYLVYFPDEWIRASRSELLEALSSLDQNFEASDFQHEDNLYTDDFETLKSSFSNELKKVVLISRETFRANGPKSARAALFKRSLTFGAGMPYGFITEDYGMIGSTPELLYSIKDGILSTFALAGTARLGEESELLASRKDRAEHELVIDDLKEKLLPFCSEIRVSPTELLNYKEIIHLKTNIEGKLKSVLEPKCLAGILSPTAALGGYPKEEGLRFLQGTQYRARHPRRYFGSAFGVLRDELNLALVSIRNVQWEKDLFFIESGGGVLPESKLDRELSEIRLKRDSIKRHYL